MTAPARAPRVRSRIDAVRTELAVPLYRNAYALMLNTGVNSVLGRRCPDLRAGYVGRPDVAGAVPDDCTHESLRQEGSPPRLPAPGAGKRRLEARPAG